MRAPQKHHGCQALSPLIEFYGALLRGTKKGAIRNNERGSGQLLTKAALGSPRVQMKGIRTQGQSSCPDTPDTLCCKGVRGAMLSNF